MQIKTIIEELEKYAPLAYQESYDNSGIQVGNLHQEVKGVLVTLDITEAVIDEAILRNCNLIIAHHPLIFKSLKQITGKNYVERIIFKAIKNDITLYAAHTNFDNVINGVNAKIASKLNLKNTKLLLPSSNNLLKLYTYAPLSHVEKVKDALFAAGAGHIGSYTECSFTTTGKGTFRPLENSHPTIGNAGGQREYVEEGKIEVLLPGYLQHHVINALFSSHPYEEVAYELIKLNNSNQSIGSGMIGDLENEIDSWEFLKRVKQSMKANCIRHTTICHHKIKKVAVCGGAGSFLLNEAMRNNADIFITSDFKYHQFFDADNEIIIADIGHFESEQFTIDIFSEIIKNKFPNFAVLLSEAKTNPINYYF